MIAHPLMHAAILGSALILGLSGLPMPLAEARKATLEPAPAVVTSPPPAAIERVLLAQTDILGSGLEHRLYRITYAPGASAPPHTHPVVGLGYVIVGKAESRFAGEPSRRLHAGDGFTDRAGTTHLIFRNVSPTQPLVFLISYAIPKGMPALRSVNVK